MLRQMKLRRWQRVCISKRFRKSKRACKSKTGICVGNDAVYGGAKASPFLFFQSFPAGTIFDKRVKKWYFLKDYGYISGTENEMYPDKLK